MPSARRRFRWWSVAPPAAPRWAPTAGYDTRGFVAELRALGVTPHVARNDRRWGAAPSTGARRGTGGYAQSQRRRKRVEEVFGWMKTVGGGRKLRCVGQARNRLWLEFAAAAYNLVRMAKREPAPA